MSAQCKLNQARSDGRQHLKIHDFEPNVCLICCCGPLGAGWLGSTIDVICASVSNSRSCLCLRTTG
jgi:hypothetical protein